MSISPIKLITHHQSISTAGLDIKSSVTENVIMIVSHAFEYQVFELLVVITEVPVSCGGILSIQSTVANTSHVFQAKS